MAKYVQKRPDSSQFQFVLRVPSELLHRYPKSVIRKSLKTADPATAARRGDAEFARYQAEFARLRGDSTLTPAQLNTLALETAKKLGSLQHDDTQDYFQDKLHAWARKQGFEDVSQFEHLPEYRDDTYRQGRPRGPAHPQGQRAARRSARRCLARVLRWTRESGGREATSTHRA